MTHDDESEYSQGLEAGIELSRSAHAAGERNHRADRQAFLDAAAIAALHWAAQRYPVDREGPGFAVRMAYEVAEALWAERERRVGK